MITRTITAQIKNDLLDYRKIILVYGPRQVGKTTLIKAVLSGLPLKKLEINADQLKYIDVLSSRDLTKMEELIADNELIFIDEAQNIPDIGINLKIMRDSLPNLKIIATGSSSFDLANQVQEPLTGRTITYRLYPIAIQELRQQLSHFELKDRLEHYLLYGMYPEVLGLKDSKAKIRHLRELASSYLYKDVLKLSNIRNSDKIAKLLKLLAFQAGSLVSLHELGKSLEMSHETVNNYIDLLEKGFIVFRLSGYSRNLRKEITKMNKVYFYDNGIRNVLIDNFNSLEWRQDAGALWENFLISERIKKLAYSSQYANTYFWRTYTGVELDYVEESAGQLHGYEFKWKSDKAKTPPTWLEAYPDASFQLINKDNFMDFVG